MSPSSQGLLIKKFTRNQLVSCLIKLKIRDLISLCSIEFFNHRLFSSLKLKRIRQLKRNSIEIGFLSRDQFGLNRRRQLLLDQCLVQTRRSEGRLLPWCRP